MRGLDVVYFYFILRRVSGREVVRRGVRERGVYYLVLGGDGGREGFVGIWRRGFFSMRLGWVEKIFGREYC